MSKKDKCEKCQEYEQGWRRALADYDNLKKDLGKERTMIRQTILADIVMQLLPALDSFDQAMKFAPDDDSVKQWCDGVVHVRDQIESALKGYGAESFGEVGEQFDPNVHEAVSQQADKEKEDNQILEIIQRGWKIDEYIVRPAKIIVNNI